MVKTQYPTAFPLKHQQKDLRLALGLAESVSQSTPIAAAANEPYKVAKSYGLSDEDFSAVIEALKAKSHDCLTIYFCHSWGSKADVNFSFHINLDMLFMTAFLPLDEFQDSYPQ